MQIVQDVSIDVHALPGSRVRAALQALLAGARFAVEFDDKRPGKRSCGT
jgi:hypothetical protein